MEQEMLDNAIQHSQEYFLSIQNDEGFWLGILDGDVTAVAEAVMIHKLFGKELEPVGKVEKYLRSQQREGGGWELFYGDGGHLSVSVEAYMTLRLLGVSANDPALQKARQFIVQNGGISQCRIFTKVKLALLGCFDWSGIPSIPPWIMLLPPWFPSTIYDMASWARTCTIPLIIVFDRKPIYPLVFLDELYSEGRKHATPNLQFKGKWTDLFIGIDHILKLTEKLNLVPFRNHGIKAAEEWMLERRTASGDWGGSIFTFYSLLGLKALGYPASHPIVERDFIAWRKFYAIETEDELRVQQITSPVWDTSHTIRALVDSGIHPDHPSIQMGIQWLLKNQIVQYGEWAVKNKMGKPGGWGFQFEQQLYPDIDDSANVVMALNLVKLENTSSINDAIRRAIDWIKSMQCKDGGWGAYDVDNNQSWLNSTRYSDMKAMIDPSSIDVTARVVEMCGQMEGHGMPSLPSSSIQKAIMYLVGGQEPEGCWFGRWGVNYIYGTSSALLALSHIAPHACAKEISKGVAWLVECQEKSIDGDGGWGESCFSYINPSFKGVGEHSTPSQTAWAILGLLAAGDALGIYESKSIQKGIQYLLNTQQANGSWVEPYNTGTGFPGEFYLKYGLYPQYFPLSALGSYKKHLQGNSAFMS